MSYLIGLSLFRTKRGTPDNQSQGEGWPLQKDNRVIFVWGAWEACGVRQPGDEINQVDNQSVVPM